MGAYRNNDLVYREKLFRIFKITFAQIDSHIRLSTFN